MPTPPPWIPFWRPEPIAAQRPGSRCKLSCRSTNCLIQLCRFFFTEMLEAQPIACHKPYPMIVRMLGQYSLCCKTIVGGIQAQRNKASCRSPTLGSWIVVPPVPGLISFAALPEAHDDVQEAGRIPRQRLANCLVHNLSLLRVAKLHTDCSRMWFQTWRPI